MRGAKTVAKGLALFGLAMATPLPAQAQDTASYVNAMQALVDLVARNDAAPAVADPVVVRATREAEALRAVIGTPKLPITGLSTMNGLCVPALKVMLAYFDIGLASRTKGATTDAALQEVKNQVETENASRYFDRLMPFMMLNVRCNAYHMPVVETFMASIPAGQMTQAQYDGVAQIRGGARDQVSGMITAVSDPSSGETRRLALLNELASDIHMMVLPMTPPDRAEIAQTMMKLRPILSAAGKIRADVIITALTKSNCGRLCSTVTPAH